MPYDPESGRITWRIHLSSSRLTVFDFITTDSGRSRFWAESTHERDGVVEFQFPNGTSTTSEVRAHQRPHRFALTYFDSHVEFLLDEDGNDGTDLTLTDEATPGDDRSETLAGWVSVLLALKAAADFGFDLRNHDPERSWDDGYADN
jgi:uncharacterized protein YndB with AHSA1/START domain